MVSYRVKVIWNMRYCKLKGHVESLRNMEMAFQML
jgi:hypothetical protein